jgi:hypothetical protein
VTVKLIYSMTLSLDVYIAGPDGYRYMLAVCECE